MSRKWKNTLYAVLLTAGILLLIYDRWLRQPSPLYMPRESPVEGRVIHIADGDTFTMVLDDHTQERVRLQGIDAPERSQAFANRSRQALGRLIYHKHVKVYFKRRDQYGRILGTVYTDDSTNVNLEMVKQGYAWHYKRYSSDKALAEAERQARRRHLGLWKDPHPQAPWLWRQIQREKLH